MFPKFCKKIPTPNEGSSITLFLGIQAVTLVVGWAVARSIMSYDEFCSFALSSAILFFSFVSVSLAIHWMFLKKSIALIITGIVFKWPILIIAALLVTKYFEVKNGPLALGALLWFPGALLAHGLESKG